MIRMLLSVAMYVYIRLGGQLAMRIDAADREAVCAGGERPAAGVCGRLARLHDDGCRIRRFRTRTL